MIPYWPEGYIFAGNAYVVESKAGAGFIKLKIFKIY